MTTVYIDMDGVVADFDGYVQRQLGIKSQPGFRFTQTDWHNIRQHNKRIYSILPVLPNAYTLISELKQLRDQRDVDLRFLTAVPKENDLGWSFWDKMEWACKYFPGIPVWFGPYSNNKAHHYKPGDILIDDRVSNIEDWESVGGKAIQYDGDHKLTIELVKEYLG